MRKITFLLLFLTANIMLAQTWTTGDVTLTSTYSVKFDINVGTSTVTMTMTGPDNTWLGIAPGVTEGNSMGNLNDDAVVYNFVTGTVEDRNMRTGTGEPPLDNTSLNGTGTATTLDWSTTSDTATGGVRTIVATRAINTGDVKDYTFPTSATPIDFLWAIGPSGGAFTYHSGGRGGVTANITLSTPEFESEIREFSIYPNPSSSTMNIGLPALVEGLKVEVYDILGKKVYSDNISTLSTSVDVSQWNSGMFLVKLSSVEDNVSLTKRFVKM